MRKAGPLVLEAPGFFIPATHLSSAPPQFSTYTAQGRITLMIRMSIDAAELKSLKWA